MKEKYFTTSQKQIAETIGVTALGAAGVVTSVINTFGLPLFERIGVGVIGTPMATIGAVCVSYSLESRRLEKSIEILHAEMAECNEEIIQIQAESLVFETEQWLQRQD